MRISGRLSVVLPVLLATSAHAQAPRDRTPGSQSTSSVPAAVRPGEATDLRFLGAPSGKPTGLWTNFKAEATVLPGDGTAFRVKVPADAPVGVGAVRVATTGGLAGVQFLMVDDLPSVPRSGKNHSAADAQPIESLCAVDGAVDPLASDYYRLSVRRGQRIAFEVVAQRLGSRMDPLARILDSSGRELAVCDDTLGLGSDSRFARTFDRDGEVFVEVRDANYEGSSDHRYRLRVGDFPAVTTAFPLGSKAGTEATFAFAGPEGERVGPRSYTLPTDAPRFQCGVKYPDGRSSAFVPVLCGDREEFVARSPNHTPETAARLTLSASISGQFEAAGARDFYEIAGKKGDRLAVRGQTRRWGSPADLYFTVYRADGSKIAETKIAEYKPATKGALPPVPDEGLLEFAIPADGTYRLAVEDLNRAGGPGMVYHVEVERLGKDFALSVEGDKLEVTAGGTAKMKVKAERRGYDGPITLWVRGGPAELAVTKNTIAAGKNETDLELAAHATTAEVGRPMAISIVGVGDSGAAAAEHVASTLAPLRRAFPRMTFVPPELDGSIGLLVRGGVTASEKPSGR